MVIIAIVVWLIGFIVGIVTSAVVLVKKPSGTLKMDYSTGEPFLFLEVHEPMSEIMQKDEVVFTVDRVTRTIQ